MEIDRSTMKHAANTGCRGVLAIARAKTIQVENHFHFPQAVIDAVIQIGSEAPSHYLALAPAHLIAAAFEQITKVRFDTRPQRPRLIRGFDHQTVTGTIAERRHRR